MSDANEIAVRTLTSAGALEVSELGAGSGLADVFGADGPGVQLSKPDAFRHSPIDGSSDGYDPLCLLTVEAAYLEEYEDEDTGIISRAVELVGVEADAGRVVFRCPGQVAGMVLRAVGVPYSALDPREGPMEGEGVQGVQAALGWWRGRVFCALYLRTEAPSKPGRSGAKRFDVRVFDSLEGSPAEAKAAIRERLGAVAAPVAAGALPDDIDSVL